MKSIITLVIALFGISLNAATFTFHAVKENWTEISVNCEPLACNPVRGYQSYVIGYWDFGWDTAFPADAYSGLTGEDVDCAGNFTTSVNSPGYQDTLTFTASDPVQEVDVWISGPYPNYPNGQLNFDLQRQPEGGVDLVSGGEAWIDFGPGGIGRIELSQPVDFGKWLWDGSINPSYVEPPALAPPKNGKAKGHNK